MWSCDCSLKILPIQASFSKTNLILQDLLTWDLPDTWKTSYLTHKINSSLISTLTSSFKYLITSPSTSMLHKTYSSKHRLLLSRLALPLQPDHFTEFLSWGCNCSLNKDLWYLWFTWALIIKEEAYYGSICMARQDSLPWNTVKRQKGWCKVSVRLAFLFFYPTLKSQSQGQGCGSSSKEPSPNVSWVVNTGKCSTVPVSVKRKLTKV